MSNKNKIAEDNRLLTSNENKALVGNSGNSDVDVTVNVDTTAMAYAMLCFLNASNQLSDAEFDKAVRKLEYLLEKKSGRNERKIINDASLPKIYAHPQTQRTNGRSWI